MFRPSSADFREQEPGAWVRIWYGAETPAGGTVGLELTTWSPPYWTQVGEQVRNPDVPGLGLPVKHEPVQVGEREGERITLPSPDRPVNQLWLIVELEHGAIVVEAFSGATNPPGGVDPNPLVQPELLIAAVESLRPYPE